MADTDESEAKESSDLKEVSKTVVTQKEPLSVIYCPKCTWPPEYCEFGQSYSTECLPWILRNCPEILGEEQLAEKLASTNLEDEDDGDGEEKKKKKRGGVGVPRKKAATVEVKIIVSRVQRQKRKYVTVINGLETIPDLKIKDAAKACGRKFSSGASVSETPTGAKEVIIQGDVYFEVPNLLINEFKVSGSNIYLQDDSGHLQPFS